MSFRQRLCQILIVFLLLPFAVVAAPRNTDPKTRFEELKAQYLSLRNTDVDARRTNEWIELARQFEALVDQNPKFSGSASALFNASILYEILYQSFGGQDRITKSADLLERLARDYPGNNLADDALLKRGDIELFILKDRDLAKRAYLEIVEAYPKGDMREVASIRLEKLDEYLTKGIQEEKEQIEEPKSKDGKRVPLILIDPGHGGEDLGAQGVAGLLEKDVTLAVAFELEKLLKERMGAVVRLTRRKDVFVPLAERTQLANDFDADLFVSLHNNASPGSKAQGVEVYYLDTSGSEAAHKLAERENASLQFEGSEGDLQFMLSDLIQTAKLDDSIILANILHRNIQAGLAERWPGVKGLGVKKAPFYVLVGAHMPCVLVEMFFIDHQLDGTRLGRKDFRVDLANSLYLGIKEFIDQQKK